MIAFLVEDISKDDFITILRSVVYLIYRKTVLTKEIVNFIQQISLYANLNENELQNIFVIDTRYELDFKEVVSSMELKSSKVMLIIFILFSEVFEEIDLSKYYKMMGAFEYIPIDDDSIEKIIQHTKEYLKITEDIYDEIYKDKSLLQKVFSKDEYPIEKFFLIELNEIKKLPKDDKINFLKVLKILMLEDSYIDNVEEDVLYIWENILEVDKDYLNKINIKSDTKDIPVIKTSWLKRFLIFSFLVSQNDPNKKQSIVKSISNILNIPKDTLDDIIYLSEKYQEKIEILLKYINSTIISSPKEDLAKSANITLNISEVALLLLPGGIYINGIKLLIKSKTIARSMINIHRQEYMDRFGIVDVLSKNSDEVIVCIDGFLSEVEEKQFDDWKKSLVEFGVNSDIKGFQWGAENYKTFSFAFLRAWYETVEKTQKEALELVFEIEKLSKRYKNISLMGHSLGARVIYHTINPLLERNIKLKNIYLFGGAVSSNSDEAKAIWYYALSIVKGSLYNFYSSYDEILKKLYKTAMIGDSPVGLGDIKIYITKDVDIKKLKNIDISDIIKGHKEYKPKLAQILNKKEIIL